MLELSPKINVFSSYVIRYLTKNCFKRRWDRIADLENRLNFSKTVGRNRIITIVVNTKMSFKFLLHLISVTSVYICTGPDHKPDQIHRSATCSKIQIPIKSSINKALHICIFCLIALITSIFVNRLDHRRYP